MQLLPVDTSRGDTKEDLKKCIMLLASEHTKQLTHTLPPHPHPQLLPMHTSACTQIYTPPFSHTPSPLFPAPFLPAQLLPVDTSREDMKENLKKSQLGSRIMFLAKCPDESQANKKMAIELVQKWSRCAIVGGNGEAWGEAGVRLCVRTRILKSHKPILR